MRPSPDGSPPIIISASRRTDIPAFFGDLFQQSVRQGHAAVVHPFSHQPQQISLKPEDVAAVVFWSKNYQPFLPILQTIEQQYDNRFLFHFTINGFSGQAKELLEPHVPTTDLVLATAERLAERFGPAALLWRFDPLVFSNLTTPTEREEAFARLARALSKKVERCYLSVLDLYPKVTRRLQKPAIARQLQLQNLSPDEIIALVKRLRLIADELDIQLFTCCEHWLADQAGLQRGHCIDAGLLQRLYPEMRFTTELHPTRPECGCYYSIDIGTYNTCRHKCLYCYANN